MINNIQDSIDNVNKTFKVTGNIETYTFTPIICKVTLPMRYFFISTVGQKVNDTTIGMKVDTFYINSTMFPSYDQIKKESQILFPNQITTQVIAISELSECDFKTLISSLKPDDNFSINKESKDE